MIGSEMLRYRPEQKYCVWDLETTSLNLIHGLPWQCSFLICTLTEILEEHDYFIKWDNFKMSRDAAAITQFNQADYDLRGKDPREILDLTEKYFNDPEIIIVGHNVLGFDTLVHQAWRRKLGLGNHYGYLDRVIDTNAISKAYKKGFAIDKDNRLASQYKLLNFREKGMKTSLGVMAKELEIEFDERDLHKGNKDIVLNWQVWKKLVWSVEI